MREELINPKYTEKNDSAQKWSTLVNVVRQLRKLCPWDREQTHASLRHLLIEEAYETIEALDNGDMAELQIELGDLLLQIILHSIIAEESDEFNLADVITGITKKMVDRHPHVFQDTKVSGVQEVLQNWESLKAKERAGKTVLSGVPIRLPALLCAYRIQEKVANVGFDFPNEESTWAKVEEEIHEFRTATTDEDRRNEFGDLLFALVNYARKNQINPEDALRECNRRFQNRFEYVEAHVDDISSMNIQELDQLWEAAKNNQTKGLK